LQHVGSPLEELNAAAPQWGGGLYLERAKAEKKTIACLAKVSLATVASVAGTTGENPVLTIVP
jgi:hypothetical protein